MKQVDNVNKKSAAADDVLESIHAVMHLFRSQQYRSLREGSRELTHMEGKVVAYFARHPDSTQSDLVSHSGRDKGQIARLIRDLRARELLAASTDEQDRRSVRLQLTPAGRALHQALQRQQQRLTGVAVNGLSASEHRQLSELLHRVRANLEAESERASR